VAANDLLGWPAKHPGDRLVQLDDLAMVVQQDAFGPGAHLLMHLGFKPPDLPRLFGGGALAPFGSRLSFRHIRVVV
jgi:hypothetical protein